MFDRGLSEALYLAGNYMLKVNNSVIDAYGVVLVSLLLTLIIFHALF